MFFEHIPSLQQHHSLPSLPSWRRYSWAALMSFTIAPLRTVFHQTSVIRCVKHDLDRVSIVHQTWKWSQRYCTPPPLSLFECWGPLHLIWSDLKHYLCSYHPAVWAALRGNKQGIKEVGALKKCGVRKVSWKPEWMVETSLQSYRSTIITSTCSLR